MKKKPLRIKQLGIEMFSIVFAVLLALALDSWQEEVKKTEKRDQALVDIGLEVLTFSFLDYAVTYNQSYLDVLNDQLEKHKAGETVNFTEGFGRPEAKSLAWSISKSTGITSQFDRELLLELAAIYTEHERLVKILDLHSEFLMKADPNMSEYTKARYHKRYLRRSIFRIKELIKKAQVFVEKHKDAPFLAAEFSVKEEIE